MTDPTHCLRCKRPFLGPLPQGQTVALCDRCFGHVMRYITGAETPQQVHSRLKAIYRLYPLPSTPSPPSVLAFGGDEHCLDDVPEEDSYPPDFDPTDAQIRMNQPTGPSVAEQHKAAWDQRVGWM